MRSIISRQNPVVIPHNNIYEPRHTSHRAMESCCYLDIWWLSQDSLASIGGIWVQIFKSDLLIMH